MLRLYLYARVRFLMHSLHTRPRVQRAPGIPCSLFSEGQVRANLGRNASREREVTFGRHPPLRNCALGGRSSIPETAVIEGRGVLEPAFAGMTFIRHCERSEAIHLSMREVTIARFARNDGDMPRRTEYPRMCGI